jgi:hypothetical protein
MQGSSSIAQRDGRECARSKESRKRVAAYPDSNRNAQVASVLLVLQRAPSRWQLVPHPAAMLVILATKINPEGDSPDDPTTKVSFRKISKLQRGLKSGDTALQSFYIRNIRRGAADRSRLISCFPKGGSMRRRSIALVLVAVLVTIPSTPDAQVATSPTAACHVADGAFTTCSNGQAEWSDVEPLAFQSDSYLYVNQDVARTALFVMHDFPLRTTPLGANQAVRITFDTVERDGAPRFERHDVDISGDGRIQAFVFGQPVSSTGITAAIGFGTSPNSAVSHVMAELKVPLITGGVTADPLYLSSSLPPSASLLPVAGPTGKTPPFIGAMNQLADQYAHTASLMGADAGLCSEITRSPSCAVFMSTAAAFADVGVRVRALATDQSDPDFTVVAQPVVHALSIQPLTAAQGLTQQEADALNALLANVEESIAFAEVVVVSANRLQGAKDAGNAFWELRQRDAVRQYASNLATRFNAQPSLLGDVDTAFRTAGIRFTFTSVDISNFQSAVSGGGLPTAFTQALIDLGADAATQSGIRESIISADGDSIATLGVGRFPDALSDPAIGAALRDAGVALNQFAAFVAATGLNPALEVTLAGDYLAAGVGLTGRTQASISLSGVPAGAIVVQAVLYWGMLGNGESPALSHLNFNGSPIRGTRVGSGPDTCRGLANSFVYRADVTPFVTGNGTYALTGVAAGGTVLGQGASLVVLYERVGDPNRTVTLHDGNIVFSEPFSVSTTTIAGFLAASPVSAKTTFIVGDGQPDPESVSFRGSAGRVMFPGPFASSDGAFWDTDTFNVSSQIGAGSGVSNAELGIEFDCLMWAAQGFSVTTSSPVTLSTMTTAAVVEANETGKTIVNLRGIRAEDEPALKDRLAAAVVDRLAEMTGFDAARFTRQLVDGLVADGQLSPDDANALFDAVMQEIVNLDMTPPVISGLSTLACSLWPPNHKLVRAAVVSATDDRSGIASFTVTGISNEPSDSDPDVVIAGTGFEPRVVWLRAERQGSGRGRVYTVTATATDQAGNSASSRVICSVPHDRGRRR